MYLRQNYDMLLLIKQWEGERGRQERERVQRNVVFCMIFSIGNDRWGCDDLILKFEGLVFLFWEDLGKKNLRRIKKGGQD